MHYDYTWVTSHRHWQRMNFDECCTFNVRLYWFFTTRWLELWAWPKIPVPADYCDDTAGYRYQQKKVLLAHP